MSVETTAGSLAEQLLSRIELRTARVCVVGLGYVGLPLAETFSWGGFPVLGFDTDPEKVKKLRTGQSYIGHISSERVAELVDSGRFEATFNPNCFAEVEVVIICVPTPLTEAREPDLSYIVNTGKAISKHLRRGQLVVLESTTYPGTTEDLLRPILEESGLRAGRDFFLAYSPEREDPGNGNFSTRTIPKVVGGFDEVSGKLAVALYEPIVSGVVAVSSAKVAEACKILENTYRAVNIAMINELKVVFAAMGIDVWEVIAAAKTKPFGFHPFYPGPGLGGHCIPVDPFYLSWKAKEWDFRTRFIELAGEINMNMPYHVLDSVAKALNQHKKALNGAKVLVLGLAYKKDIDDLRESPSLTIIELLQKEGAQVSYNDPYFPTVGKGRKYDLRMTCAPLEDLAQYDCVLIVTDHSDYDYERIVRESQLVVDTRNATRGIRSPKVVRC